MNFPTAAASPSAAAHAVGMNKHSFLALARNSLSKATFCFYSSTSGFIVNKPMVIAAIASS